MLISDFAAKVTGIPKNETNSEDLKKHFENLGYKVREAKFAKNYNNTLMY
jgi:hypothetical protein